MLVDGPRELVVQLPGLESKADGCKSHQTRQGDQERLDIVPEPVLDKVPILELVDGVADLVVLDSSVDEDADVVDDEADDLNGVLQSQGVPHKPQLVQVAKHEDGEVGGNSAGFAPVGVLGLGVDRGLVFGEDIAVESESALQRKARRTATYDSRARAMMAWMMAVNMKAHVHLLLGMYILGARRTGFGSVVGKPSRSW